MPRWRYRRCPWCRVVLPAGLFRCLDVGEHWRGPQARRACPRCGYVALTRAFPVIRERHPEAACRPCPVRPVPERDPAPVQLTFLPEVPYVG